MKRIIMALTIALWVFGLNACDNKADVEEVSPTDSEEKIVDDGEVTDEDDGEVTDDGGLGDDGVLSILCLGNSFTKDAVEHLPGMIYEAGITNVKIVQMFYPARTLPVYWEGYSTTSDYTCYTYNPGTRVWVESSGKTLKEVVKSDTWDVVTLQEHTGTVCAWEWTADEKNAIEGLIRLVKADQGENVPKFSYIMSQAYQDLSKTVNAYTSYFTNQLGMFEVIAAQGKKVLDETSVEEIIGTGTGLQNIRTSSVNNSMDLTRDGYHMDFGLGRYMAACVVFESLISPVLGIYLDDNTYRYSDSASGTTDVTDENQPIALQAARYAIESPFVITNMSRW